MIFGITQLVKGVMAARLAALSAPLRVNIFYGAERLERKANPENSVQVLEDDESGNADSWDYSTTGTLKVTEGVKIVVQAHDPLPGASQAAHRRMAKMIAGVFMTLWVEQSHTFKHCSVRNIRGGFVRPNQSTEIGAQYVLNFSINRKVPEVPELLAAASQVAQTSTTVGQSDGAGGITGSENSCG